MVERSDLCTDVGDRHTHLGQLITGLCQGFLQLLDPLTDRFIRQRCSYLLDLQTQGEGRVDAAAHHERHDRSRSLRARLGGRRERDLRPS